jgi:hypothetical protein
MKILHGPSNIGGMAGVLSKAQRQCGMDAYSFCFPSGFFDYASDRIIKSTNCLGRVSEILSFFLREGHSYEVFQFYFGVSYSGNRLYEISLLKFLGKKIFFYFCGCDVRNSKFAIRNNIVNACSHCWPMLCSANRNRAIFIANKYADAIFVSTPDLLEFIPNALYLPQPIDLEVFSAIANECCKKSNPSICKDKIIIAHAPSNQSIKGTKYLLEAVLKLQKKGLPVDLVLIEGKSYTEAIRTCAKADLIVDQLLIGAYGQFSVEMMAMGKPVVCYIREDLLRYYPPTLPIISASPDNIESILDWLIERREDWSIYGNNGIDYVKNYHDSIKIGEQLASFYQ